MFVGSTRETLLDRADPDLSLAPVVVQFGKFLKILVTLREDTVGDGSITMQSAGPSAFDVMRQAMHEISRARTPSLTQERTRKDKLYNAVVENLKNRGLQWRSDEVESSGVNFVKSLTEVLWYIDGHHATFSSRGYQIPPCFADFQGFNIPEVSKHRKRAACNMSAATLEALAQKLFRLLQANYFLREGWSIMRGECEELAHSVQMYAQTLQEKNKAMKTVHSSPTPWRSIAKGLDLFFLKPTRSLPPELIEISSRVAEVGPYCKVDLHSYLPINPHKRYLLTKNVKEEGLEIPSVLLVYSTGNNCGNSYFVWHVPDSCLDQALANSQSIIEDIKKSLPTYHTRAMRSEFIQKFGRITSAVKPAVLRYFYKDLTGDSSSSETLSQEQVDERVTQAIEMEDPDIILDLRKLNSGRKSQYDTFWEECTKFLQEEVGTAVDDRRHSDITHIATAISVRDFRDQVASKCPEGTCIPSVEWVRLQFWPKTPHSKRALHHTGRFKVRFRVQQRQFRKDHPDAHYAAGVFSYQREYAVSVKEHSMFVCLDDKHRIKVGEPGFPVAAAERGRRVLQAAGSRFLVGDHDFTKFSIIPSVALQVSIPDDISGSWYSGKVSVGMKEGAFEPSSPLRHASELCSLIQLDAEVKPILFLYTDGGPDHRLTYVSVQLSLIALFLSLDLDYLCAARTAPFHSWRNPVERIMSIVNLGLQCVGLARGEMSEDNERLVAKAGSMKEIRKLSLKHPGLKEVAMASVASAKIRLAQVLGRLQLKGEKFQLFVPATQEEMDTCWSGTQCVDDTITPSVTKASLTNHPRVQEFMDHCCRKRHYSFEVRKCGSVDCNICKPVRFIPPEVFEQLKPLPDPTPGVDNHFLPFLEVFGQPTSEEHRPSLHIKKQKKTLPFSASVQHVKNIDMMLLCEECEMWRLLYSKKKLKAEDRRLLALKLDDLAFSCGDSLQDLDFPAPLNEVFVRSVNCFDPIEKLYYSAGYEPICLYCAGQVDTATESTSYYPQCIHCSSKPQVSRK